MNNRLLAVLAASSVITSAFAQTSSSTGPGPAQAPAPAAAAAPPAPPARGPAAVLASEAVRVAVETCAAKGFSVGATVVDSAGIPKALLGADGANARAIQSSTNKAVTAVTFGAATSALGERAKSDADFAAKVATNPSFSVRAGAVLLKAGSDVIGAIGVGGARPSEVDEACAQAAVAAIQARLK